ncbi:hypothetical protein [Streptomyces sp. NPDC020983]|uniref:hypothetical protein n=1 Tax=Streptomyces sp. NPDC020983 TaxID=3365106 RepID=UPI003788E4A8
MSTNYYAFGPGITDPEGLHIGQSAAGWRFLFHAHVDRGITTLADWDAFISRADVSIQDEYGRDISVEEMRQTMTETTGYQSAPLRPRFWHDTPSEYVTSGGHSFSRRDFH